MDQITDHSKSNDSTEKSSSRRNYTTRENMEEWYQRTRSDKETGKRKIRENILQRNHKPVDVRHLEQQCMIELIKRNY